MGVAYTIRANVVDISSDNPTARDSFFVDTNIWFWLTYTKATPQSYQLNCYPSYLNQALAVNARIHYNGLSLSELAHNIERTEREIFLGNQVNASTPKEYRHNFTSQRANVVSELQAAWNQVKSMGYPISVSVDNDTTDAALKRFENAKVDGYDLFLLEAMKKHGITNIMTDDGDFATVSGIQVFTANRGVLAAARKQKKIIVR